MRKITRKYNYVLNKFDKDALRYYTFSWLKLIKVSKH